MDVITKTGNHIVDEIGQLNITGNVIPEAWYSTIVNNQGKVNCIAIFILSGITYWYRPTEVRDESSNKVIFKSKFSGNDYLQRSYKDICEKYNISTKQAREALKLLEELGVVKRHFKDIDTGYGKCHNVMYLELVPSALKKLTYPDQYPDQYPDDSETENTSLHGGNDILPKKEIPPSENGKTNTKNITNIITKTITTSSEADAVVDDESRKIFHGLNLSDRDISSVLNASGNDIQKCNAAVEIMKKQSNKIFNTTGWLIKAVQDNFQPSVAFTPDTKVGSNFCNMMSHDYDFSEIEKLLLNQT